MGTTVGSFEAKPEVEWEDNKLGTVAFTMTFSLYNAMTTQGKTPGYRCRIHPSTMRGNFAVEGLPIAERIEKGAVSIELETVASGFAAPVDLQISPDGASVRIFRRWRSAWEFWPGWGWPWCTSTCLIPGFDE